MSGRKLLLTGDPGSGKTTLVKNACKILRSRNKKLVGFYTEEIRGPDGVRAGFDVISLDGKKGILARDTPRLSSKIEMISFVTPNFHLFPRSAEGKTSSRFRVGKYFVFLDDFEKIALPILESDSSADTIVVIDEIGKMEMFSQRFVQAIQRLFSRNNVTILATIPVKKGAGIPLVEKLRENSTYEKITVEFSLEVGTFLKRLVSGQEGQ